MERTKLCTEYIGMGFNSYKIDHVVYEIMPDLVQTIGKGRHSLGMLEEEFIIRLYKCQFDDFPLQINRDTYGEMKAPIDSALIFAKSIGF